jgi:hypothetical protein
VIVGDRGSDVLFFGLAAVLGVILSLAPGAVFFVLRYGRRPGGGLGRRVMLIMRVLGALTAISAGIYALGRLIGC